jgi:hypothetical protein
MPTTEVDVLLYAVKSEVATSYFVDWNNAHFQEQQQ